MSGKTPRRISPADGFKPSPAAAASHPSPAPQRNPRTSNPATLVLLALLGFGVIAVLLWEPESSLLPSTPVATDTDSPPLQTALAPNSEERPFEEALRAQQRQDAQAVLEQLLPLLTRLEDVDAPVWAPAEYAQLIAEADRGDVLYTEPDYAAALAAYQTAVFAATALVDSIPGRVELALAQGNDALEAGDPETARTAFELSLKLEPTSDNARRGLQRAEVNTQVFSLRDRADQQVSAGELQAAFETLRQAQALDPQLDIIEQRMAQVDEQIRQQQFRAAMSEGFQALSERRFADADRHFRSALSTGIGNAAARAAMDQVVAERQISATDRTLASAAELETREAWQQALELYSELLDQDGTLVEARLGKLRTEARAELDRRFEAVFEDPLELQDTSNRANAAQLLEDARRVAGRGPLLAEQIRELEYLLEQISLPRELVVRSDGQTEVEILRVGNLGTPRESVLQLAPGRYVAVGSRSGFRDVRLEFAIDIGQQRHEIDVRTTEKISQ